MKKKYKNTLLSLFILMTGALFLVSGISYAFLSYQGIGNKNSNITSGGITFNYKEKSNYISLNEVMPMTDSQGKAQNDYFEFDISSTGVKDEFYIPYDIVLKKTNNSSNIDEAIKVYLTRVENGSEIPLVLTTFNELGNYINQLTNTQNEKLLHNGQVITDNYNKTFRIRIWVDYDTDFTLSKYNNATFGLSVNVYSKGKIGIKNSSPGLYDDENVLIASWDSLINDYGLDIEEGEGNSYSKIITDNPNLKRGSNLVIGNVSKIGDNAFQWLGDTLHSITIPQSVTAIGNNVFFDSYGLKTINVPSSVTTIGSYAFESIKVINYTGQAIDSNNNNWGALSLNPYIEDDFCYSDSTKTNLLAYIGNSPTVTIPSSVTTIGKEAFYRCYDTKSVSVPSTVTSITDDYFTFYGIKAINYMGEVENPMSWSTNSYTNWGALSLNPYIEDDICYSDSTKTNLLAYIGNSPTVTIPSSVTKIGKEAFYHCKNLANVTLEEPSQLSQIGTDAFSETAWYNTQSANGSVYLNGILVGGETIGR